MEGSLQLATSGSIVLDTMVEMYKPLLDNIPCFSQTQPPLPVERKPRSFTNFWPLQGLNEQEGGIFWKRSL